MKSVSNITAFARILGFFVFVFVLLILLPQFLVNQFRLSNETALFTQKEYRYQGDIDIGSPPHPLFFQYNDLLRKQKTYFEVNTEPDSDEENTRINLLDFVPDAGPGMEGMQFHSEAEVISFLLLKESFDEELQIAIKQLHDPTTSDWDLDKRKASYLRVWVEYLRLAEQRLIFEQFDEALYLIQELKKRINQLNSAPNQFFGSAEDFNRILLFYMVYQYPTAIKAHPDWFMDMVNQQNTSIPQDLDALTSGEATRLHAYFNGLKFFYRGPLWADSSRYYFSLARQSSQNFQLGELSNLMLARVQVQLAQTTSEPELIEKAIYQINQVILPSAQFQNYQDDIQVYSESLEQRLRIKIAEQNAASLVQPPPGNLAPINRPSGPGEDQFIRSPVLPSGRPISREEWIEIFKAAIRILENGKRN